MLKKVINKKYVILVLLSVFCFSSGTLSGSLLHGHEVHIENNHTHFHHIKDHNGLRDENHNENHDLGGGSNHHDTENILSVEFLLTTQTRAINLCSDCNKFLSSSTSSIYSISFVNTTSRTTYSSSINKSRTTNLYRLHSSVLI